MFRRWLVYVAVAALATAAVAGVAYAKPGGNGSVGADVRYQTKVFVGGAPIHGANGLAVDQSGRLIVASGLGCEILALDPRTGYILDRFGQDWGSSVEDMRQPPSPDDVAVGPDGSIYWTDFPTGQVGRLAPDGAVSTQLVAPGMNPIAFDEDGRLFVGQAFMGDGLYEIDPNLVLPPEELTLNSDIPTGVPPYPAQLNGFDFGPDGMLYAPQPFLMRIVRIDPDTGDMVTVADVSAVGHPGSVEFDSKGRLYAEIADTGTILRVDPDTGEYQVAAQAPSQNLDNMVFDARDRLFVSEADGRIFAVAPGGGVRTLSPGGLMLPGGIALMQDDSGRESLFVADVWSLPRFDVRSGRFLGEERYSHLGGSIVQPWSVSPDGRNVIVASWMTGAVQIWDPVADEEVALFVDSFLPLAALRFEGEFPGDLVVAELLTHSVVALDATGARSTIASGFVVPAGLAATDDDLWVGDWATGSVWQIVAGGAVLTTPQVLTAGLSFPEGMAVDRDGSLLVVEAGAGRLSRIDPRTGDTTTVVEGLQTGVRVPMGGGPPTWALSSVAVSRDGTIFVTGDRAGVVYRIWALPASRR